MNTFHSQSPAVANRSVASRTPSKQTNSRSVQPVAQASPLLQKKENNTGLPDQLKSGLEVKSGFAMDDVRVHYNSDKPAQLQAHAYAQGADIYLGPGQEQHLPHEAWHVVQQKQGRVKATTQFKSALINDDSSLEQEATVMGDRVSQLKSDGHAVQTKLNATPTNSGIIQRAMKFELQITRNFLYRKDGDKLRRLPRKYGPEDYIVKGNSGVRLESETGGQCEFETSWERKWPKMEKQIKEAQQMVRQMNNSTPHPLFYKVPDYRALPFSESQLQHLSPGQEYKMEGGLYDREQDTGKVTVTKDQAEIRYDPSEDPDAPDANLRGRVSIGTKLELINNEGEEEKGWLLVKSSKIGGWIKKSHTEPYVKTYESNASKDGVADRPLKKGEDIVLRINDPLWVADFQVSESFELGQFESYMQTNARDNSSKVASSGVAKFMSSPYANKPSENLRNFFLMVFYFIARARNTMHAQGKLPYSKSYFRLMGRTDFGSVYKSDNLSDQDREIFNHWVENHAKDYLATLKCDGNSPIFKQGHKAGGNKKPNPTINKWLTEITKGEDILSGRLGKASGAMGKFEIHKEQGKNKNLVRYENRNPRAGEQPASNWLAFAATNFFLANMHRPRPNGKGETGLQMW